MDALASRQIRTYFSKLRDEFLIKNEFSQSRRRSVDCDVFEVKDGMIIRECTEHHRKIVMRACSHRSAESKPVPPANKTEY
jgi:hypothetical protein